MAPACDGLLVIDKPEGITSRDAVNRAQRWFPRRVKIGHAGTLDPLATGVLVLCIGQGARLTEYVQRMAKVYHAAIHFGAFSDTDDGDGVVTPVPNAVPPARQTLERVLPTFVGTIEQVPPDYSAAKVSGQRAFHLARNGQDFSLSSRLVTIHRIDLIDYQRPRLEILVHCGKGTYIRSLARDLGQRLGCGGYIESLRRLAIGDFTEADALPLDTDPAQARQRLLPCQQALKGLPSITLSQPDAALVLQGNRVATLASPVEETAVFDEAGRLIAIAKIADGMLIPTKVLASA
jgi:tRNA pseudouridine55 synthase